MPLNWKLSAEASPAGKGVPIRFVTLWRWAWALLVLYGEVLCFYIAASNCSWPTRTGWRWPSPSPTSKFERPDVFHVALIADPQLTDRTAYGQEGLALWLTEYYTDYYMLRSERALRFVNRPDAYFVLGDLFNGGRDLNPTEWARELHRFTSVFPLAGTRFAGANRTAVYHVIAGNHDFGLGYDVVDDARTRFRQLFGATTRRFKLANHTVVVVDSAALAGQASEYDRGSAVIAEVEQMLAEMASDESSNPRQRVLLTHIPLYRPPNATCGPLRRSGTRIDNKKGYLWQNLLDAHWTWKLLRSVKPAVVFSGDDHDYCEQHHAIPWGVDATEYTIPTFSFAQGNFHPHIGFLSLNPATTACNDFPSWAVSVCPMVQQFLVYGTYGVAFVANLLCACIWACTVLHQRQRYRDPPFQEIRRSGSHRQQTAYHHLDDDNLQPDGSDIQDFDELAVVPPCNNSGRLRSTFSAWSPGSRYVTLTSAGRTSLALRGACVLLLEIMWQPLLLYLLITIIWWII